MSEWSRISRAIADALLAGPWTESTMEDRAAATVGLPPRRVRRLVRVARRCFSAPPLADRDSLVRVIDRCRVLVATVPAWTIRRWFPFEPAMAPRPWSVPSLTTPGALADWLMIEPRDLDWLADRKGLERSAETDHHRRYRYRWVEKRSGGQRLIETPIAALKSIQRRILHEILAHVPPHEAAHGFRPGRSVLSYATPHAGRALVARFDLAQFFASITSARVFALFHAIGYPETVARTLAGLCTNRTPGVVVREEPWEGRARWSTPHLPQGAPTSPAIANLCAYRLDVRLSALAATAGARYTRYADDLAFSFETRRFVGSFETLVAHVAMDEGFGLNFHKTRAMPRSTRQQLTGVVVNATPNVPRDDYDRLKATLHNCVRHGPSSQARGITDLRLHLLGRVSWIEMVNASRGRKLRQLFNSIDWSR